MELFCFAARKTGPTGSDSQPSSQYQRSLLMTVNKRCFPQVMFSSPWLWVSLTCLVWIERREQRKVPSWNLHGYLQQHVFFNLSPGLHSKMTAGRRRVKENFKSVAFNRKRKDPSPRTDRRVVESSDIHSERSLLVIRLHSLEPVKMNQSLKLTEFRAVVHTMVVMQKVHDLWCQSGFIGFNPTAQTRAQIQI